MSEQGRGCCDVHSGARWGVDGQSAESVGAERAIPAERTPLLLFGVRTVGGGFARGKVESEVQQAFEDYVSRQRTGE